MQESEINPEKNKDICPREKWEEIIFFEPPVDASRICLDPIISQDYHGNLLFGAVKFSMLEAHRCPGFHQGDLFHRSLGSFRGHPIGSAHPAGGARRLCGQITTALLLPRQPLQAGPHDLEFIWMLPSFARINGLVHGKSTGNPWILPWNIGCSYKFSLEPIQWNKGKILQLCFIEFDEWRCYFCWFWGVPHKNWMSETGNWDQLGQLQRVSLDG